MLKRDEAFSMATGTLYRNIRKPVIIITFIMLTAGIWFGGHHVSVRLWNSRSLVLDSFICLKYVSSKKRCDWSVCKLITGCRHIKPNGYRSFHVLLPTTNVIITGSNSYRHATPHFASNCPAEVGLYVKLITGLLCFQFWFLHRIFKSFL
jgi:hypothetical protein